jgi:polyhydroxybutyrate depolymerase
VAPTGVPTPPDLRNSWEITPDQDPGRDDLKFANDLLDNVIASACVDESRVYSTGMSAGGYFTSVLVCDMADRIAAAASIAGLVHADDCSPSRPVPFIAFHGTDDAVVPYAGGGVSTLAPDLIVPLFELVIPDEFSQFASGDGCSATPDEVSITDEVTALEYPGCADSAEATFYRIEGGGHTWPGSQLSLAISESIGLGATTADIDATAVSWEFFSRHALGD